MPPKKNNAHNRTGQVAVVIAVELGRTQLPLQTLLNWSEGDLIELDKISGEAVDVLVEDRPFAKGEVLTVGERFGVRLIEIV
ncbi:MAG: FliM/FliN family flagellar motor switch protein [bacterium]|nr:FliM/FliN family flagellar motor switch protein [bacterium]